MEIILTVAICIWLMYKAGMITGEGWLTQIGHRPPHAPGPVPISRRYPNGSDLVRRTRDPTRTGHSEGISKKDMKDLAERYHMRFIRKSASKPIQGVYCDTPVPIVELDELYEYGFDLPVHFTWGRRFKKIRYKFYCPEKWFDKYDWKE